MTRYDLIIIGSGPAGLAAAIYAQRARLNTLVVELREHADALGAVFAEDEVVRVENDGEIKRVVCEQETYEAKALIIATGAHHRKLGVPGEEELAGAGVSYCAT